MSDLSEAEIQARILLSLGGRDDVRVWRANTGAARTKDGRMIRFGVVGQADVSGILRGGRRLEIEVKSKRGNPTKAQRAWAQMIIKFGGLHVLARSVREAVEAVEQALGNQHNWMDNGN